MKSIYAIVVFLFFLVACSNKNTMNIPTAEDDKKVLVIDGSSTVFPVLKNAAEIYQHENQDTKNIITVNFSGTTKGFEKLVSGEADIIGASRPINPKEERACRASELRYIELMIGYDGIVVATPKNNAWINSITLSELKKMWEPSAQYTINQWSDVNASWPNLPLHLYGAGKNSGTYDYFTEAITGSARNSRKDYFGSEDDNYLVHKVSGDSLAIGFFGYHYFIKNNHLLKALHVDNEKGYGPVAPNDSTIKNNVYQPLSRPLFVYISEDALKRDVTQKFLTYLSEYLPALMQTSEYIAPSDIQILQIKEKIKKGTSSSSESIQ